jgi:hypothetical protein
MVGVTGVLKAIFPDGAAKPRRIHKDHDKI